MDRGLNDNRKNMHHIFVFDRSLKLLKIKKFYFFKVKPQNHFT